MPEFVKNRLKIVSEKEAIMRPKDDYDYIVLDEKTNKKYLTNFQISIHGVVGLFCCGDDTGESDLNINPMELLGYKIIEVIDNNDIVITETQKSCKEDVKI